MYADALTCTRVQYPSFRGGQYPIRWDQDIDKYSVQLVLGEGEPTESVWPLSEEEQSQVGLRHMAIHAHVMPCMHDCIRIRASKLLSLL